MKYHYITVSDLELFEEKVNELLEMGWKLYEGTTPILSTNGRVYYCQAFTKDN